MERSRRLGGTHTGHSLIYGHRPPGGATTRESGLGIHARSNARGLSNFFRCASVTGHGRLRVGNKPAPPSGRPWDPPPPLLLLFANNGTNSECDDQTARLEALASPASPTCAADRRCSRLAGWQLAQEIGGGLLILLCLVAHNVAPIERFELLTQRALSTFADPFLPLVGQSKFGFRQCEVVDRNLLVVLL